MDNQYDYQDVLGPAAQSGQFNAHAFLVAQMIGMVNTATLVKVVAVTNTGGVSSVGFVDVQPLVNQLDGANNAVPHGVLHKLPYFRIQGGTDAIIMDPKAGDIGIAVFADHDISTVANTKKQANPGSERHFNMADGLYLGGVLNGVPTQYMRFSASGIEAVSPMQIKFTAPTVNINGVLFDGAGDVTAPAGSTVTAPNVVGTTNGTFGGKVMTTHTHSGVTTGGGNTGAPV